MRLDPASGAIIKLVVCPAAADRPCTGRHSYASPAHPLAQYSYRSRSKAEGSGFYRNYSFVTAPWGPPVFL